MLYFAYGPNLSRAHMALWCPGSRPLVQAVLEDHRLVFRLWTDIVPSAGQQVWGGLYAISARDLSALDEYKDCPDLYERASVTVRAAEGPCEARTYRMRPGYAFAPPAPDYLNLILQGYEDWGLDADVLPAKRTPRGVRWHRPDEGGLLWA